MPKDKIKNLVDRLNMLTEEYNNGRPLVADLIWDSLYIELLALEKKYPEYKLPNSPTSSISYNFHNVDKLKKVEHQYPPMLSLDKTKDLDEVKEFLGDDSWIAMCKMDGLTCRLTYEDGTLIRAETRGNGLIGEDVTHNAWVVANIPKLINYDGDLIVDGEMICTLEDFELFKDEYANPRNFAAGSIRLLNSEESFNRNLTFVAWDCFLKEKKETLSDKLFFLDNLGFTVVPYMSDNDIPLTIPVDTLTTMSKECGYQIDGIVFKINNCEKYYSLGNTDHHFRGGIAYKFYDEEYTTTLRTIEWTMGRTGILTPVAVFEPISVEGSVIERASLHNLSVMNAFLGVPYVNQEIRVFKANEIIPQISWGKPISHEMPQENKLLLEPDFCPYCNEETEVRESEGGTINLFCTNPCCQAKLINRLDHFCGKKGLDIKGLSVATLEKLIDWGWVNKISDIFNLEQYRREWANKAGFGEKSVDNILNSINASRETTLEAFISGMGIPLIGKTYAKQLAERLNCYKGFRYATRSDNSFDFTSIKGFGCAMEEALISFDYSDFDSMVDNGLVTFKSNEKADTPSAQTLQGLTFVVTGKLKTYKNRDMLKEEIESLGGKVASSVTSKTNYLINNDINSETGKNKTAKSLGIPIISEEQAKSLMRGEEI
jgi:DNA ligase (NAD+)